MTCEVANQQLVFERGQDIIFTKQYFFLFFYLYNDDFN